MTRPLLALALLGLCAASACSLILNFEPAGQPCAKTPGLGPDGGVLETCLPAFECKAHVCLPVSCDAGTAYSSAAGQCLATSCASTVCAVGQSCVESTDGGIPSCQVVAAAQALGHYCAVDGDCGGGGTTRVCLHGAVPEDLTSGRLRPGVCVEACAAGKTTCSDGSKCETHALALAGGSTSFCLPNAKPCASKTDCVDNRLTCTVFDHPTLGPTMLCDTALVGGGATGASCTVTAAPGKTFCDNGLCTPPGATNAQCAPTCNETNCPLPSLCILGELTFAGTVRHVPMCGTGKKVCSDCTSGGPGACGPDAPHCTKLGLSMRCLAACTLPSGGLVGQVPSCPSGYDCLSLTGVDGPRCVPSGGLCP